MKNNEYNKLLSKLDSFIRKFYKNRLIRGGILSIVFFISLILLASVSEFFGHFSVSVRTFLFYTLLAFYAIILVKFIILPILHLAKIGETLSYKKAASIISSHFSDVEDKLLNTLELYSQDKEKAPSHALLVASIEQKISQIKPIPFNTAIKFRNNLKYLKLLVILVFVSGLIYFFLPSIFTEGSARIVEHRTYFEPKAPFRFVLLTDTLDIQRGADCTIKVQIEGDYVPNNILISYGGNSFVMNKDHSGNRSKFDYNFKDVNNSMDFSFEADNYNSQIYRINVLPTPMIINFNLSIDVPEYTNEHDTIINNIGDITIPYGTKLSWKFKTNSVDALYFNFNDSTKTSAKFDSKIFTLSKLMTSSCQYGISYSNEFFTLKNAVKYSINVIPDLFPSIEVNFVQDTINRSVFYFKGVINDDYGFKRLSFNYKITDSDKGKNNEVKLPLNPNISTQEFYYVFDFASIANNPGENIDYYFEVWDNDQVNGSKSSRSQVFQFNVPTQKELAQITKDANKNVQSKLEQAKELAKDLKKSINELQKSNIDKSKSDWEKSKLVKQILDKHKKLNQLSQQIADENKMKNDLLNSFSEQDKEILEKQQQIEDLLENLLSDELKDLMEQIEDLQEKFDEKRLNEMSEDLQMSYDDLTKQLDRDLEILKKHEIEQKINNISDRLEKLSEKQDKLSEETDSKKSNSEDLKDKQEQLKKDFEDAMEEYKETTEQNSELENPMNMDDFEKEKSEISEEMKKSDQNLSNNKKGKASKNQKSSAKKMKDMASAMQQMMAQNMTMQTMENIDDLRQILDNLITFSYDQEDMISQLKKVTHRDPKYIDIVRNQKKLNDDYAIIKDSLNALALRTPQISSIINKELLSIDTDLRKTDNFLEQRRKSNATKRQQFVMTSANNLALLLSEVLDAMQNQMASSMSSGGEGQKQKQGKPSIGDMKKSQESLKSQLQNMLKQMKDGKGTLSKKAMNKRLAKMLAQQEIFRKMMNDVMKNGNMQGETQQKLNEISKLVEKTKKDIINGKISTATLQRQNRIVTRLLDAENAERKREIDKKRESRESRTKKFVRSPEDLFKDKDNKSNFKENLNITNLRLYNYYKNKYKDYLFKLNEE